MNDREICRAERVDCVIVFGGEVATDFDAASKATQGFTRLRAIQAALSDARTGQQVPTGGTALEVRFDALRLDLQNIARTARSIALEKPGFADAFRLPDPPTDGGLLTTAETYVARLAARPDDDTATKAAKAAMTAAFLAHELPADFITHPQADVQAIRDEYALREKNREKGVRSTGAVGPLLKEANDIITMLNAIMHNKYSRDPAKLRAWLSASHVERAPQREKKAEPPTPPTPAPAA